MILYYFLRCSCILLLGLLIYGQTFQFDFVFDDRMFVVDNPYIRSFSHVHLIWHTYPMTRSVGFYSFALNYFLNGLSPQGYHIFNLIVHFIATGLVWALADILLKITKKLPSQDRLTKETPFIIAVLFLVHPCQTQAVSYITQRFESIATVFYLGTMYCYLRARISTDKARKIILFGLAGLFTILGILTKEVVITVPAMMLASEWVLFPKKDNKMFYIVLTVGGILLYFLFTKLVRADLGIFLKSNISQSHDGDILTASHYLLTQMRVFLTFLRLLVLPIHQNLDYDYPASSGLIHPPLTLVGLCAITGIISLIIKLRRRLPLIAFGLAWILITFSINLAPRENVIFEHKLYLISFGFFLAFVATLFIWARNQRTFIRIVLCIIVILSFISFHRNKVWQNELTLWNDVVQKSPHKKRPFNNLGLVWARQGNLTQAISDYSKAIELDPRYINAYINRGFAYNQQRNFILALADYNKAIKINPRQAEAYINRGNVYDKQGNFTLALADYNKAIEITPEYAEAYNDRGDAYFKEGNLAQAASDYNKAIELKPEYADVYYNLAFIYYKQGRWAQAISNYSKAIEITPQDAQAYNNRAVSYYQLKEYDKAWDDVHSIEGLHAGVDPKLINALRQATGQESLLN